MRLFYTCIILIAAGLFNKSFAQSDTTKKEHYQTLIQFSGMAVNDNVEGVPYALVYEKNSRRGTVSDYTGFFSFVAEAGDTIIFNSIGYKNAELIIPDTLTDYRYSVIQLMKEDTIILETVNIYPWPSKAQFANAFVNLDLADQSHVIAAKNLKRQELANKLNGVNGDSQSSHSQTAAAQQNQIYSAGQLPQNNLLNPVAWSKFIKSWKNGSLSGSGQ